MCICVYLCVCVCKAKQVNLLSVPRPLFVTNYAKIAAPSQIKWQVKPLSDPAHLSLSSPSTPLPSYHEHNLLPQYKWHEKKVNFKKLFQSNLAICCCLLLLTPIRCHCFYGKARQSKRERETHRVRGRRREQQENEVETHRHTNIHTCMKHKGNRNLLNKKQFKEFLTNPKKKKGE